MDYQVKHNRRGHGDIWGNNHGVRDQRRGKGRNFGNNTNNKARKEIEINFTTQTVSQHLVDPYNTVKQSLINRINKIYHHGIYIDTALCEEELTSQQKNPQEQGHQWIQEKATLEIYIYKEDQEFEQKTLDKEN